MCRKISQCARAELKDKQINQDDMVPNTQAYPVPRGQ